MNEFALSVGMSETNEVIRAQNACKYEEYFCAGCFCLLTTCERTGMFLHPESDICTAIRSHRHAGLLYLYQAVANPQSRVQLLRHCSNCAQPFLTDLRVKESSPELVSTKNGSAGLIVESFDRLLLTMRSLKPEITSLAAHLHARVVELDARNVLSGGPALIMRTTLRPAHLLCSRCKRLSAFSSSPLPHRDSSERWVTHNAV